MAALPPSGATSVVLRARAIDGGSALPSDIHNQTRDHSKHPNLEHMSLS
jgi:hypothetical protein